MTAPDRSLDRPDLRLTWAEATDVGKVRRVNEDSVLSLPGLWLVADGMGGHTAGDVASSTVCDVFERSGAEAPLRLDRLEELVATANSRVHAAAVDGGNATMGTTLVGVALFDNGGDDGLVVMNIGDSRCYAHDDTNGLRQITTDHSVVQELLDAGSIDQAEAATHPDRNVVTRAIGIEPAVAADFTVLRIEHDTRLMLCSDGVSGPLGDEVLGRLLEDSTSPQDAVDRLVGAVLEGSAPDNATALVIDVSLRSSPRADEDEADDDITGPRPGRPTDDDITGPRPERPEQAVEPLIIDAVPGAASTERPLPPPATVPTAISEVPS